MSQLEVKSLQWRDWPQVESQVAKNQNMSNT